jgi:hypothetical protein
VEVGFKLGAYTYSRCGVVEKCALPRKPQGRNLVGMLMCRGKDTRTSCKEANRTSVVSLSTGTLSYLP